MRTCHSRLHHVHITGADIGLQTATAAIDLQYLHLEHNNHGIRTSRLFHNTAMPFTVQHSHFDLGSGLLISAKCNVSIIDCRFDGEDNVVSIYTSSHLRGNQTVEVVASRFSLSSFRWTTMEPGDGLIIRNTSFTRSSVYLMGDAFNKITAYKRPLNIVLDRCSFSHSDHSAIATYFQSKWTVHVTMSNTVFRQNIVAARFNHKEPIKGNIAMRNVTVSSTAHPLSVSASNCTVTIANSMFTRNYGGQVAYISSNDVLVENNTFLNNRATATLKFVVQKNGNIRCARNVFENPGSAHDILADGEYRGLVDARYNWWGTVNAKRIFARNLDLFSNMNLLGETLISPVLSSSPFGSSSTVDIAMRDFKVDDYEIGGRVTKDTTVVVDGNHRRVRQTIYVPANKTLVMHLNTALIFDRYVGVLVEGMECSGCFDILSFICTTNLI